MKDNFYNPKEIIKQITSNEFTLEQILSNNILCQTDIKMKFAKLGSFFLKDEIISKMIDYCLSYSSDIKDYEHMSHNSCEILSQVRHSSLVGFLVKRTEEEEDVVKYPILDKIFKYIDVNSIRSQTVQLTYNDDNQPLLDDLLSGYFKRIFYNIISQQRSEVS
jgi:hypothetical protein